MNLPEISDKVLERLQQRADRDGLSVDDLLTRLLDDEAPHQEPNIPYRLLLEHTTDGIALVNPQRCYVYVNPAFGKLTGFEPADMIGKTDRELGMPDANAADWQTAWDTVIKTRQEQTITFDHETPNGKQTFESHLTPIYDDDANLLYLLAITRDVTERSQTQEMLQDFADRLPGMILRYRLYPDGRDEVSFASEGVTEIYELTIEEALEDVSKMWEKVHPDDLPDFAESIQVSAANLSLWDYEWRIRMDDGSLKWVAGLGTPRRLQDGSTVWNTLLLDITARKEAEAQNLEMERMRIEMQEQHNIVELKERFIATASHDFRTPLAVIQSTLSLLESYDAQLTTEQKRAKLRVLQDQVTFMTHLLDEVLTISKSQANKLEIAMTSIDLREFVRALWENVVITDAGAHLKALNNNVTIDQFIGDPYLLRQAFENLLGNALKYTPEGKRITFDIANTEAWLTFKIVDEGYGIPMEDQPHLFEPFHRARNVSKLNGTGLGLTIARDFILLHQGEIAFESKEGEGTTFTVNLPIAQDDYQPFAGRAKE